MAVFQNCSKHLIPQASNHVHFAKKINIQSALQAGLYIECKYWLKSYHWDILPKYTLVSVIG